MGRLQPPTRRRPTGDADGAGDACDACPIRAVNDVDGDGCGNVDNCPQVRNPLQRNGDGDPLGDLCDKCPEITDATQPDDGFDGESNACDLAFGHYGACLVNGVQGIDGIDVPDVPPPGSAYVYLVTGWDAACGLGSAGVDSSERKRVNTDAGACAGGP